MPYHEHRIKHLDMIQQIISRMAQNSFSLKNFTLTLTAALYAVGASDKFQNHDILLIAVFFPSIPFWLLDSYFLGQERMYRKLYDHISVTDISNESDFSMNPKVLSGVCDCVFCPKVFFSYTLKIFYLPIMFVGVVIYFWLTQTQGTCQHG